jgi:hypothetical protein
MAKIYAGSDDRFYTDWEVSHRMESGAWEPCMWDPDAGWELVEGADGLVWLVPVDPSELPAWADVQERAEGRGREVVDTRG